MFDLSLYLVTDRGLSNGHSLDHIVEKAVQGGVTMVQLREKNCSSKQFLELALHLKRCLRKYSVPLIINDRLDIALACEAEGLHLGQSDLPYPVARRLFGKDKIIGLSVESIQNVYEANKFDLDYIGISPVFNTQTKSDIAPPLGLEGVKEITKLSLHPSVGIGGINIENAHDVILAGAQGVCVVSAIMSSEDPEEAARELRNRTFV